MSRNQARDEFIKSIADLTDGTTIKIVKGDKTLIEIDGDLISKAVIIAEKFARLDEIEN